MDILHVNSKNICIEICYFAHINYTFYKKNNLNKNCPHNGLKQDIYNMRKEGNVLLL